MYGHKTDCRSEQKSNPFARSPCDDRGARKRETGDLQRKGWHRVPLLLSLQELLFGEARGSAQVHMRLAIRINASSLAERTEQTDSRDRELFAGNRYPISHDRVSIDHQFVHTKKKDLSTYRLEITMYVKNVSFS